MFGYIRIWRYAESYIVWCSPIQFLVELSSVISDRDQSTTVLDRTGAYFKQPTENSATWKLNWTVLICFVLSPYYVSLYYMNSVIFFEYIRASAGVRTVYRLICYCVVGVGSLSAVIWYRQRNWCYYCIYTARGKIKFCLFDNIPGILGIPMNT